MTEEIEEIQCIHCGRHIEKRKEYRDFFGASREISACDHCIETLYLTCAECQTPVERRTSRSVITNDAGESVSMCPSCARRFSWKCAECIHRFHVDIEFSLVLDDGRKLCRTCFDENYFVCSSCRQSLPNQFNAGNGRCFNCELGGIAVPDLPVQETVPNASDVWFKKDAETRRIIDDPRSEI